MSTKKREQFHRSLKDMFKFPVIVEPATVKDVDTENLTCTVLPVDGPEIYDVRLKAGIDGVNDGVVQIPAADSTVLIAMIGNDAENWFVLAFSEVEETLINGGENGGLINIETLIEQLNKTNEVVNAIKDSLLNWTPTPNDGGAALKTYAATAIGSKVTGDFSNMEDEKVKH